MTNAVGATFHPMTTLLHIEGLKKSYGGVRALRNVQIDVGVAEIHGLVGENGAGKSTLIKCLSGVVSADSGRMELNGAPYRAVSVQASEREGIAVIHQESTAFPDLNTVDNVFVGRELTRWRGCRLDRDRMRGETRELMNRLGQTFDILRPVRELSVAQRQMVSMARALSQNCRLLIMDEPTASLSSRETERLLSIVRELRESGVSVLYVSHRLEEIFALTDRVTVLRDGEFIGTEPTDDLDRRRLIQLMVGRTRTVATAATSSAALNAPGQNAPGQNAPGQNADAGETIEATSGGLSRPSPALELSVRGLTQPGSYSNISFDLLGGEVLGLAGLVGAGRSEVARAIFGIDSYAAGEVRLRGQLLRPNSVPSAVRQGLALVPEDRQHQGLVLPMTVCENLTLSSLRRLTKGWLLRHSDERRIAADLIERLGVKTADPQVAAETLSGGNQQKVVIAKWLACDPRVLLLDEPTRGVDVSAKAQVHELIRGLSRQGMATLVISSELDELLAICDRIMVLRDGEISGVLDASVTSQEEILQLALPE